MGKGGGGGGATQVAAGGIPEEFKPFINNVLMPYMTGSFQANPPASQYRLLEGITYPTVEVGESDLLKGRPAQSAMADPPVPMDTDTPANAAPTQTSKKRGTIQPPGGAA